jgi:hypothetical protein
MLIIQSAQADGSRQSWLIAITQHGPPSLAHNFSHWNLASCALTEPSSRTMRVREDVLAAGHGKHWRLAARPSRDRSTS